MIHSGEAIVEYLEDKLKIDNKFRDTNLKIYASNNVEGLRKVAMEWLNIQ